MIKQHISKFIKPTRIKKILPARPFTLTQNVPELNLAIGLHLLHNKKKGESYNNIVVNLLLMNQNSIQFITKVS